jgi:hypothetical protein
MKNEGALTGKNKGAWTPDIVTYTLEGLGLLITCSGGSMMP